MKPSNNLENYQCQQQCLSAYKNKNQDHIRKLTNSRILKN